ncbi:MAG: glycosyltransferase [Anaerolineales bacterium]|nr:glycosyltransferase [Anaerolineales bacterium]
MTKHHQTANSAQIQFKLATVWQAKGQVERALSGYRAAIALQPDYIPPHLELGNLLCQQGRLEEAIDVYRRASALNPHEPGFAPKLAAVLARKNAQETGSSPAMASAAAYHRPAANGPGHILLYTDCPGIHGAEQCHHLLMLTWLAAGYHVTCAQSKADHHLIHERQQAGIQHLWLEPDDIYDNPNGASAFVNEAEAAWVFNTARPDLIVFSGGGPVSNLAAQQVAGRLGIPYIVIVHCVTASWAKKFAAHLPKLPAVYQQAESVIAVSQENLDLLHSHFGLPPALGQVIYNGRPAAFFAPIDPTRRRQVRRALAIPEQAVVVFTSGRMELVKGYQHQLKAIKQLKADPIWPRLYFMWAGTGTLEAQLRAVAAQLAAEDHIRFLGHHADVPALLDAADIFVLPSHFEGMPLSVMEAMAKGLPVIATAVSGIVEELGDTGQLLPNPIDHPDGTINGLVATLAAWGADANLRASVGRACRQRAEALFQIGPMTDHYLAIVRQTL